MTRSAQQESDIESRLLSRCRQHRFLCMKFVSPARDGVPDRVVITPARTVFVEVKRPGGKLRRLQQVTREKMQRHGASVFVVDDAPGVDALVETLASECRELGGIAS